MIHKMPTVGGGGNTPSNYEVASYIKTDTNTQLSILHDAKGNLFYNETGEGTLMKVTSCTKDRFTLVAVADCEVETIQQTSKSKARYTAGQTIHNWDTSSFGTCLREYVATKA